MKLVCEIDDASELIQTVHRIEETIDALFEVWNKLSEVTDENLGAVRASKKDGEPTLYY